MAEKGVSSISESGDSGVREEILERHVDHLLGQLYHQIDLIKFHKQRADHLKQELDRVGDSPVELDEARRKMANLREEIAGRKEVELDLRRRLELLEREEDNKVAHIKKLEKTLHRIWNSPHYRAARSVKNVVKRLLGRSVDNHESRPSRELPKKSEPGPDS